MALSQLQCLNEYHVNLRTTESKPEFLYSEEQRLALEKLLDEGPDRFQEFINTNRIRPFLSDRELAHLSASKEPYCSDVSDYSTGLDGDRTGTCVSLQYWPERSDDSLPPLDLGWPQRANYRGVTRVAVHAQPPLHGDAHIKEVIRRIIARAQKVIAVVMDLFTDVDIFKDLLYASAKRNVAVYIILESTGVPHFLKMCESASMHTGHLKNLRVRSIRGTGFFTQSSKKVCGSQSQKFMFVDGDKAVSGSYSFTWTASRLDRSIITVLTGQAVDFFDQLFQDLYMMSDAVDLNKINLEKEQKLEPVAKAVPILQHSTTMALKLINPKYSLVFGNATTSSNHVSSEACRDKSNRSNQMKEVPKGPYIHPGLLHLEKANMIDYLPVWPEPDPPSDVIGFINIKNCNKPLQAHLTRSELYEVSQAIRFKDPIQVPQKSLSEKFLHAAATGEHLLLQPQIEQEENNKQILPPSSLKEQAVYQSPIPNPKTAHSRQMDERDPTANGMEKQSNISSKQREEKDFENIVTNAKDTKDSQISENVQIVGSDLVPTHTPDVHTETTSDKRSCENIAETISNKDLQNNQWNPHKLTQPVSDTLAPDHADCTVDDGERTYSDSSSSFSSVDYSECSESVIVESENVAMVNRFPADSMYPDESNHGTESGAWKTASRHEIIKETEESKLQRASPKEWNAQHLTGVTNDKSSDLYLTSFEKGLSESVLLTNEQLIQETDSILQQAPESRLLLQVQTDAQVRPDEETERLQERESYSGVHHTVDIQTVEGYDCAESQLIVSKSLLQDKEDVPYAPVQKTAEAQCIVFSDTDNDVPKLCSGFGYTSVIANDDSRATPQS